MSQAVSGLKKFAAKIRHKLSATFINESGAFDMMSVLVGAVVTVVLVGGTLATTLGVIPWTQDNAVRSELSAVSTAQGIHKAQTTNGESYAATLAALKTANLISQDATDLYVAGDGDSWAALAKSKTGKWFKVNSKNAAVAEHTPAPVDAAAAQTAVDGHNTAL